MMRAVTIICCLAAVAIAIVGIQRPVVDYAGLAMLCGTFLGVGVTGKVVQKKIEVAKPSQDTSP
jgi:hypothetical protein